MTANKTETVAAEPASRASVLAARLVPPMPGSRVWGWVGPLLVTVVGAFLRFYRLGTPKAVVFDETYYVGDAYGILRHGVEINHVSNANTLLAHGKTNILSSGGELVVHPPLGKMMIAVGEWIFGLTPFGWRFTVALVGSLGILMTARITRRMTRSTLLGCVAGLLLALDGLELVMSRTAILDVFVMFWVLAAFGFLVIDRDRSRARIAGAAIAGSADSEGPKLGMRWLRVAAGLCIGLAVASKWNGIWYLPAFLLLTVFWDLGALRAAGFAAPWRGALVRNGKWLPVSFAVVPLAGYLATWSGWFASPYGYDRNWAALHGNHTPVWSAMDSLYQYHTYILKFGLGLTTRHPYESAPWDWLWFVTTRPVSFYYATPKTCGASACSQEVLALGTPLIWLMAIPVLVACAVWWVARRDWRPGAVLMGVAAGWLPWFWFQLHDHRTEFYFYAVVFEPFLIIGITLCLGLILGRADAVPARRAMGAVVSGAYLLAVLWNFWYMYPLWVAQVITEPHWLNLMWYRRGWI